MVCKTSSHFLVVWSAVTIARGFIYELRKRAVLSLCRHLLDMGHLSKPLRFCPAGGHVLSSQTQTTTQAEHMINLPAVTCRLSCSVKGLRQH